jgi:hypothetical protein
MIIVIYTDGCLLYAKDTSTIDEFLKILRNEYKRTLNNPYLTENANIHEGRLKNMPTPATAILHSNKDGLECQESWNYPSLIGQLNYLSQKTRLDISFDVHQCARFP